jgi:hypothetical protein
MVRLRDARHTLQTLKSRVCRGVEDAPTGVIEAPRRRRINTWCVFATLDTPDKTENQRKPSTASEVDIQVKSGGVSRVSGEVRGAEVK